MIAWIGGRMFDWDADYDDLVHGNQTNTTSDARPEVSGANDAPPHMGRVALGAALLCAAFIALFPSKSGTASGSAVAFAMMSPFVVMDDMDHLAMPVGLRVYSESEFRRFQAGVAGISDSDVIAYARLTKADLVHAKNGLGADALNDVLILLQLEMDRRGLAVFHPLR
ncbi:hypothetical protein [Roseinatronobacter sp.]